MLFQINLLLRNLSRQNNKLFYNNNRLQSIKYKKCCIKSKPISLQYGCRLNHILNFTVLLFLPLSRHQNRQLNVE